MVRQVIALPATATLLEACEFFIFHRLLALPVVDPDRRIVGVLDVELYTDEVSDLVRRQESEDLFQLVGVRLAQAPERRSRQPSAGDSRGCSAILPPGWPAPRSRPSSSTS